MTLNQLQLSLQFGPSAEAAAHRELLSRSRVTRWIRHALAVDAEITVRIVDAEEGRKLNREYRKKDYATNVLTFTFDEDLPDIPDSLSGEISYDADSDTYARPISGGGFSVDIQDCVKSGDVYTVTAALIRDENEAEPQAIFTAELVPNPREDNTVFVYSIRTVKQIS